MKRDPDTIDHTVSGGNVFADLGLDEPEVELMKAKLAYAIAELIAERGLTQTGAASVMGLKQPNVSLLIRGHTQNYSLSRLIVLLNRLGRDVFIGHRPKPKSQALGRTFIGPMMGASFKAAEGVPPGYGVAAKRAMSHRGKSAHHVGKSARGHYKLAAKKK